MTARIKCADDAAIGESQKLRASLDAFRSLLRNGNVGEKEKCPLLPHLSRDKYLFCRNSRIAHSAILSSREKYLFFFYGHRDSGARGNVIQLGILRNLRTMCRKPRHAKNTGLEGGIISRISPDGNNLYLR